MGDKTEVGTSKAAVKRRGLTTRAASARPQSKAAMAEQRLKNLAKARRTLKKKRKAASAQ